MSAKTVMYRVEIRSGDVTIPLGTYTTGMAAEAAQIGLTRAVHEAVYSTITPHDIIVNVVTEMHVLPLPTETGSVIRVTEIEGDALREPVVALLVEGPAREPRWRLAMMQPRNRLVLMPHEVTDWEAY